MPTANSTRPTGRSFWTVEPGSNQRAFRRARRHSRIVRILRIALPLLIVVATAGITITTHLNRLLAPLPAKIDTLVVSGSKITMDRPRLTGFTRDERAYELHAKSAVQDLTKPNLIELQNIDANVQMQDRSTMRLMAPRGLYNNKAEHLQLDHNILITSTSGYEGRLKEAKVDIGKGHVTSDQPVEMKMLQGTLDANRLEITDSGALIRFDRGVHMVVMLNKSETKRKNVSDNKIGTERRPAVAEPANTADNTAVRAVITRLPPSDPRRLGSFASVPKNLVWLRLPPHDPRRFNELTTGPIR